MVRSNNAHLRALEKIVFNPEKFGFTHIVSAPIEQNLYHNEKGLLAQPDIILESSTGDVHIIEYKGNGDEKLMDRAQGQLANAAWWFGRYRMDVSPEKIHTYIISGTDPKYKDLLK